MAIPARESVIGPTRLFCERSSKTRLRHAAKATAERVELMRLEARLRVVREAIRQRTAGKGPEREKLGRLTEVTAPVRGSQVTLRQRHGVVAAGFQEERAFSGSERCRLASRRKRPSWVRERECGRGERKQRNSRKNTNILREIRKIVRFGRLFHFTALCLGFVLYFCYLEDKKRKTQKTKKSNKVGPTVTLYFNGN